MDQKPQWEIVDEQAPRSEGPPPIQSRAQLLEAFLGRWWRWKLAGLLIVGAVVLSAAAVVAGAIVIFCIFLGLGVLAVARVRNWLGDKSARRDLR